MPPCHAVAAGRRDSKWGDRLRGRHSLVLSGLRWLLDNCPPICLPTKRRCSSDYTQDRSARIKSRRAHVTPHGKPPGLLPQSLDLPSVSKSGSGFSRGGIFRRVVRRRRWREESESDGASSLHRIHGPVRINRFLWGEPQRPPPKDRSDATPPPPPPPLGANQRQSAQQSFSAPCSSNWHDLKFSSIKQATYSSVCAAREINDRSINKHDKIEQNSP
jgi:hypothetical protein